MKAWRNSTQTQEQGYTPQGHGRSNAKVWRAGKAMMQGVRGRDEKDAADRVRGQCKNNSASANLQLYAN